MILPKQKVSTAEKYKVDKVSGLTNLEQTGEYYLTEIGYNDHYEEILSLYKLLEDEIDEKTYKYVLNPFNTKVSKYTKFRGRLRNFNILSPVLEMFLSEFGRRKPAPNVIQSNPLDKSEKDKALDSMLKGYFAQKSINALNKMGVETGKPSVEQPPVEQAKEEFDRSYSDNRVISGQEALDYIIYDKDLQDEYINLYEDYLITGRAVSYKAVKHNDIHFEHVPALEAYFPHSVNFKRLEDRDWFVRKYGMTPNQLLDRHKDSLSDKLLEKLDDFNANSVSSYSDVSPGITYMSDDDFNNKYAHYYKGEENAVVCYHVVFRSYTRIGILQYENKVGEVKEMEVEDNYKLDKENGDIKISYEYRNALYETTKITFDGHEEFIETGEIAYDRTDLNSKGYPVLPYNGIALVTKTGEVTSLMKGGKNYQIIYNILKYNFEKIMNKNKDKLAVIPLGLLNKGKQGWDEEKAMYYAEANSTLFVDETSPSASLALQGMKVMDMGLGSYIAETFKQADTVKNEWWDSVGMNRQRYGETKASDGKATTEQAIFRSSLISENLVRKFEKFQEKDYGGLLDLSKLAWINGIKGKYINTDGKEAFIELNEDNALYHKESDYDVHVTFSAEEETKRKTMEEYMFNYTQNSGKASAALEALDASSFAKGREILTEIEKATEEREQANLEADRASNEKVAELERATKQEEMEIKRYEADRRYDAVMDSKRLEIANREEGDSILEAIKTEHQINKDTKELENKDKELNSKISKERAETGKIKKETALMTKKDNTKTNN